VDSIEHGDGLTEPQMEEMARRGIYWVPTIMVGAYVKVPAGRELDKDGRDRKSSVSIGVEKKA